MWATLPRPGVGGVRPHAGVPPRRRARREALRIQARILADGGDPAEALHTRWLIAGPGADRIGEVVDPEVRDLGPLAVAEIHGDVFCCEKVAEADEAEWLRARRGSHGLHFRSGRRFLPLREALGQFAQQEFTDWPFQGPRLVREYLEGVDEAGGFIAWCAWQKAPFKTTSTAPAPRLSASPSSTTSSTRRTWPR